MSAIVVPGILNNGNDSMVVNGDNNPDNYGQQQSTATSARDSLHEGSITESAFSYQEGGQPPEALLPLAERAAVTLTTEKKMDEALHELIKCTALSLLAFGGEHWRHARSYANLAQGYLDLKGIGYSLQSEQHAQTAKSILLKGQDNPSSEKERVDLFKTVITTYYILARSHALLKRSSDAEVSILKATSVLNELKKMTTVTDDYLVPIGIKLNMSAAKISWRLNKFAVAISHCEAALELGQPFFGENQTDLIPIYQLMGQIEQGKGEHANHENAVDYYVQAHTIATKNHKEGSIEVADTARALAIAYSKIGDVVAETSSESYLNECLGIYLSVHGPNHTSVCQVQRQLARLLIRTNRQEEGIKLLRSSNPAMMEVYGEFSDEVLESHKLIGSTLLAQCNMEPALKAFQKCLQIEELRYGNGSKKLRPTQKIIDSIMADPAMAAKQSQLKSRPRFATVVNGSRSDRTGMNS